MIVSNGIVIGIVKVGGNIVNGIPQAATEQRSSAVECNISYTANIAKATDTAYTTISATILVDALHTDCTQWQEVEVADLHNRQIGRFLVKDCEALDYVGAYKLSI